MIGRPLRGLSRRAVAGVLLCSAAVAAPVVANEPAQPRLAFTLDQRLEASGNTRLSIPSEGSTVQSVTRLGFALTSDTRVEQLRLTGSSAFRLGRTPDGRINEFDDPRLGLSYRREAGDSEFAVSATVRRSQLEFLRLTDFLDEDGNLDLPEDFEDLVRTGRRTSYDLDGRLLIGREAAPFGVTLTLGVGGIDYSSGAPLADIRTWRAGVQTRARLSPVMTATLGYQRQERREEAAPRNLRVTDAVSAGLSYDVSRRTQVSASLGWTRVDRTGTLTRRQEGLTGSFGLNTDTPLGPVGLTLSAQQIEAGERVSGSVNRTLALPGGGNLSGSVGIVQQAGGDPALIGRLGWSRPLPSGGINLSLARAAIGNDDPRIRTTLSSGLTHEINRVSSVRVNANFAQTTGSATRNQLEQADLSATYSHQLTPDWALTSGVGYRLRREGSLGRANSPEVFVGMGRSFDWPL